MWEYYPWLQKQNSHVSQAQCCTDEATLFPGSVKAEELLHYIALYGKEMLFLPSLCSDNWICLQKSMFLIWIF